MKYYIDKEFVLRQNENGWPERFVKFDHEGDAETEKRLKRYQYNLAKAKEESLVIEDQGAFKSAAISSISIDRLIDITEPTPDSFIDLPVEVEFVTQFKRGNGEWIDFTGPINVYTETRTVCRLKQPQPPIFIDGDVNDSYEARVKASEGKYKKIAAEWLKAGLTPALVKKKIARLKEADLPSVPMDPNAGLSLGGEAAVQWPWVESEPNKIFTVEEARQLMQDATKDAYIKYETSQQELDAANQRIKELEAWQNDEIHVWSPIIDYCQDAANQERLGLKLGASISARVLEILKTFNQP
jgi:hypothetical protein